MALTRREFVAGLGMAAGAVAFAPSSLLPPAVVENATLLVGDVFTIAGRYAVHPLTRKATTHLQQFVVTAVNGATMSMSPQSRPVSPTIATRGRLGTRKGTR